MQRFYKKELISTKLYATSGAPITFINIGDDTGILKTENEYLINQLDSAVARAIGGLIPISEDEYVELEKKSLGQILPLSFQQDRFSLNQQTVGAGLRSHLGSAVVGSPSGLTNTAPVNFDQPKEPAPPLKVETEFSKPVTKRAYRKRGPAT